MIEIKNLTKQYDDHIAVSKLSFTVESGHIYGFLGPNGAGKTTTMNIMTGCLAATEGQVSINGHDIYEDAEAAKRLIGYLPEMPPLYLDMSPTEYLRFVAKAKGVKRETIRAEVEKVMEVTQIGEMKDRLIKNLSKGYRQRVGIAQALLGDPEVIIFDEPTVGLDPLQIIEIRDLIKELGKTHTVILSSHILSEVQAVCDEVMIISHGKLVASDTPDNLERLFEGATTLELEVKGDGAAVANALKGIEGVAGIEVKATGKPGVVSARLEMQTDRDVSEDVFFALADARLPILLMRPQKASLEQIFLELTSSEKADAEIKLAAKPKLMRGKRNDKNEDSKGEASDGGDS